MSVRIAINGFGRIGRNVPRAIHESVCVAVEASAPFGWERYVGERGTVIGMTNFGRLGAGQGPVRPLRHHRRGRRRRRQRAASAAMLTAIRSADSLIESRARCA